MSSFIEKVALFINQHCSGLPDPRFNEIITLLINITGGVIKWLGCGTMTLQSKILHKTPNREVV